MTNSSSNHRENTATRASSTETLPLLYRDEHLVVVNKPSGLLVHRSPIDRRETRFALQLLRNQLGQRIYPVHRLDKPTSGLMVFALNANAADILSQQFANHRVRKAYLAVVRGYSPAQGSIDHPLRADPDPYAGRPEFGEAKPALTHYQSLAQHQLNVEIEGFPTSRYSLVLAEPQSGRTHQIRRHMKHIAHPIIGDAKHGRGRHNRYFAQQLGCPRLLLHALALRFRHPLDDRECYVHCPVDGHYAALIERFGWRDSAAQAEDRLAWRKVT